MSVLNNNYDFFTTNLDKLDYNVNNGLVIEFGKTEYEKYILKFAKEKLSADAVFFYQPKSGTSIPLIYFKKMVKKNYDEIAKLHKLLWNKGEVPFYFIVLPNEILIYSSYKPPKIEHDKLDPSAGLLDELNVYVEFSRNIQKYRRSEILSGSYWEKNKKIYKKENHVSQRLLNNLNYMKEVLIKKNLSKEIVHSILIRSMFIKYLEDRKDTNNQNVFPKGFFNKRMNGANSFTDLLSNKKSAYEFFKYLETKFNGDTFKIEKDEEEVITQEHLNLLRRMLTGEEYLPSKQTVLWPLYSFDVIPVELLSIIYQAFFHSENRKNDLGTYYTPKHIVDFMLDEVLPWSNIGDNKTVLDPACGSGIFLVEAYRRLINRWMKNNDKLIQFKDLWTILKNSIFGVDINYQAIQITALSLYLTICDYLEPKEIWYKVKFEPLINSNLIVSDFFNDHLFEKNIKFDIIVGNPPWEESLTDYAISYIKQNEVSVGNKQICEVFLWKVARDFIEDEGTICMLIGSKPLLFNRRSTDIKFRNSFFSQYNIKKIINLSELRYSLFFESNVPASIIILSKNNNKNKQDIMYITVKSTHTYQDKLLLSIESEDIHFIPNNLALANQLIWKILMYGQPRDYELINKLNKNERLNEILTRYNVIHAEGFIEGKNKKEPTELLFNKPYLKAGELERYQINEERLALCKIKEAVRDRSSVKEIFQGPHLIIDQHPKKGRGIISAVLEKDAVFTDTYIGVHNKNIDFLSTICSILNSNLILYYLFLTSRQWKVDRGHLQKSEIMNLPISNNILKEKIKYNELINFIYDDDLLNQYQYKIMDLYELNWSEKILVIDKVNMIYNYYWNRDKSHYDSKLLSLDIMKEYGEVFCKILNESFLYEKKFKSNIYFFKDFPILMINVELSEDEDISPNIYEGDQYKNELFKLDNIMIEEKNTSVFINKQIRRYTKNGVIIIKPNKYRYWIPSNAIYDADKVYSDIMSVELLK
jgi:hypothetical protein